MKLDEKIKIAKSWIHEGKFNYEGVPYVRGINTHLANIVLREIMTMPISDLAQNFHDLMATDLGQPGTPAKGFTIGNGKVLFWYITHQTKNGKYKCLSSNTLKVNYVDYDRMITIHY
jgi:hypothetical protein